MKYNDQIIYYLADKECEIIARKVLVELRKMNNAMLSGDDTCLKNTWEEICVQVQQEQSIYWNSYLEVIYKIIYSNLNKVDNEINMAIWLQTREGMEWECDESSDKEEIVYGEGDVANYIADNYILAKAGKYSNKRIREYIDKNI